MLQLYRALETLQWIIHLYFQVCIYFLICLEGNSRHQWISHSLRGWVHLSSPYPPNNENELPAFKETGNPHTQGWTHRSLWRLGALAAGVAPVLCLFPPHRPPVMLAVGCGRPWGLTYLTSCIWRWVCFTLCVFILFIYFFGTWTWVNWNWCERSNRMIQIESK